MLKTIFKIVKLFLIGIRDQKIKQNNPKTGKVHVQKQIQILKEPIDINYFDIDHILVLNYYSIEKNCLKCLIACVNFEYNVKPLLIKLLKLNGSIKSLEKLKYMQCML